MQPTPGGIDGLVASLIFGGGPSGTDFANKTFGRSPDASGSHQANTLVDILGSGWLLAVFNNYPTNSAGWALSVQVDGGVVRRFDVISDSDRYLFGTAWLMLRFETSLKVTADSAASDVRDVMYLLD